MSPNDLTGFFDAKGKLPERLNEKDLKPKPKPTSQPIQDDAPSDDTTSDADVQKEKLATEDAEPKGKDVTDILNDLGELTDKENVTYDDVADALGGNIETFSKEDEKLANELGVGAEEVIEMIDAARQLLYLNLYDKRIDIEALEDELDDLIQNDNRTPTQDARMKQLNGFLTPARKARKNFVDGIPYKGGLRKRLERIARLQLAKLVKGGKVPEWLVLVILMGVQEGKLVLKLYADDKSLPKI